MRGSLRTAVERWGVVTTMLVAVLAVLVVLHGISTIPGVRSQPGRSAFFDDWVQGSAYALCGIVALLGARRSSNPGAAAWALVGAVGLRALAFLVTLGWLQRMAQPPYPSVADALWIGSSLLLVVALILRVRTAAPRMTLVLGLDALAVGMLAAAVAIEAVFHPLVGLNPAGTPREVVATNLAYPVLDVAMLVVAAALLGVRDWRPPTPDLVLVGAVTVFAVIDVVFLYRVSAGTWQPGSPLATMSMVATAVIALSPFISSHSRAPRSREGHAPLGYVAAALTGLVAIGFLFYDDLVEVPLLAVTLASLSLVVVFCRGVVTLLGDRADADTVIAATNEELLRFQALVETSGDFIAIAGMDGKVTYVNPAGG